MQQVYRAFYLFEPLHFQTDGTRLSFSDSRLNASTRLVIDMVDYCDFGHASKYLHWITIDRNRFLLKWNRLLWSLCHRKPTMCSDADFVRQVCERAAHRIVKLTRLPLSQLLNALEHEETNHESTTRVEKHELTDAELKKTHYNFEPKNALDRVHSVWDLNIDRKVALKLNQFDSNSTKTKSERPTHVLYLVRDPRAVYASRKRLSWCLNSSCSSIQSLCGEMQTDLNVFEKFHLKDKTLKADGLDREHGRQSDSSMNGGSFKAGALTSPSNFSRIKQNGASLQEEASTKNKSSNVKHLKRIELRLIRFEDFALRPLQETKRLYEVLRLPFTKSIERYVRSHTGEGLSWSDPISSSSTTSTSSHSPFLPGSRNGLTARLAKIQLTREQRNPHSTKRESPMVPFAWRHRLSWPEVEQLQNNCSHVMQQLGYRSVSRLEYEKLNDRNAVTNLLTSAQLVVS